MLWDRMCWTEVLRASCVYEVQERSVAEARIAWGEVAAGPCVLCWDRKGWLFIIQAELVRTGMLFKSVSSRFSSHLH